MTLSKIFTTAYAFVELIARCMVSIILLLIVGFALTKSFQYLNHIEAGMWIIGLIPITLILTHIALMPVNKVISSLLSMLTNTIRGFSK